MRPALSASTPTVVCGEADDCVTPWQLIDTIPGAIAFDWWESLGAVLTTGGNLFFGQIFSPLGPMVIAHTVPLPMPNPVDVGLVPDSPYGVWNSPARMSTGSSGCKEASPTGLAPVRGLASRCPFSNGLSAG